MKTFQKYLSVCLTLCLLLTAVCIFPATAQTNDGYVWVVRSLTLAETDFTADTAQVGNIWFADYHGGTAPGNIAYDKLELYCDGVKVDTIDMSAYAWNKGDSTATFCVSGSAVIAKGDHVLLFKVRVKATDVDTSLTSFFPFQLTGTGFNIAGGGWVVTGSNTIGCTELQEGTAGYNDEIVEPGEKTYVRVSRTWSVTEEQYTGDSGMLNFNCSIEFTSTVCPADVDIKTLEIVCDGELIHTQRYFGGFVGASAVSESIVFTSCTMNGSMNVIGTPVTESFVAGFVGEAYGGFGGDVAFENCVNNAMISGISDATAGFVGLADHGVKVNIKASENNGAVEGSGMISAGFVGYPIGDASITIEHCQNNAAVAGVSFVGGAVACVQHNQAADIRVIDFINNGNISSSNTAGNNNFVGGVIGSFDGNAATILNISGCTNYATISSAAEVSSQEWKGTGGIVGGIYPRTAGMSITIEKCVNLGTIESVYAGGIVGQIGNTAGTVGVTVSQCISIGKLISQTAAGALVGEQKNATMPVVAACAGIHTNWNGSLNISLTTGAYTVLSENWMPLLEYYQDNSEDESRKDLRIRLISVMKNGNLSEYEEVGYYITAYGANGQEVTVNQKIPVNTVYESLLGYGENRETIYKAADFDVTYFMAMVLAGVPDAAKIIATPYARVNGIETIVKGLPFEVTVKNGGIVPYKSEYLTNFQIVIPKEATTIEKYTANELRYYFNKYYAVMLNIVTDGDSEIQNEFLIGNTNRDTINVENGQYQISMHENKIHLSAGGILGYEAGMKHLNAVISIKPNGKIYYPAAYSHIGNRSEAATEVDYLDPTGDARIMIYNLQQHNQASDATLCAGFQIEMFKEYRSDILALQEFAPYMRTSGFRDQILALGYTEVTTNDQNKNWTPIFYDADKYSVVESKYVVYTSSGADGHSQSYTYAVFKEKATNKQFIVFSTYYSWASDAIRNGESEQLLSGMKALAAKYPSLPIIGGGDINNNVSAEAVKILLKDDWFRLAFDLAKEKNDNGGHHATAVLDSEFGVYKNFMPNIYSYKNYSIDHAFVRGDVEIELFYMLTDRVTMIPSDHSPIFVDINF